MVNRFSFDKLIGENAPGDEKPSDYHAGKTFGQHAPNRHKMSPGREHIIENGY